jgi:hypothetical protein
VLIDECRQGGVVEQAKTALELRGGWRAAVVSPPQNVAEVTDAAPPPWCPRGEAVVELAEANEPSYQSVVNDGFKRQRRHSPHRADDGVGRREHRDSADGCRLHEVAPPDHRQFRACLARRVDGYLEPSFPASLQTVERGGRPSGQQGAVDAERRCHRLPFPRERVARQRVHTIVDVEPATKGGAPSDHASGEPIGESLLTVERAMLPARNSISSIICPLVHAAPVH